MRIAQRPGAAFQRPIISPAPGIIRRRRRTDLSHNEMWGKPVQSSLPVPTPGRHRGGRPAVVQCCTGTTSLSHNVSLCLGLMIMLVHVVHPYECHRLRVRVLGPSPIAFVYHARSPFLFLRHPRHACLATYHLPFSCRPPPFSVHAGAHEQHRQRAWPICPATHGAVIVVRGGLKAA
ncbi:hypothetical protein DFH06DRAFT_1216484 [Mycena polygramma]|nr:hypothetical protein DFH06DRAFT_1216484 [Mycena polygramma]